MPACSLRSLTRAPIAWFKADSVRFPYFSFAANLGSRYIIRIKVTRYGTQNVTPTARIYQKGTVEGMNLRDWLNSQGRTATKHVAGQLDINPKSLRRIARGEYRPSYELAGKISAATGGHVTIEDLLGDLPVGATWSEGYLQVWRDARLLAAHLGAEEVGVLGLSYLLPKRPQAPATAMRGAA